MATEAFSTEEINLLDGSVVELRPLPIGKMKKVMREWLAHTAAVQNKYTEFSKAQSAKAETDGSVDDEDNFDPVAYAKCQSGLQDFQYDALVKLCKYGLESQLKGDRTEKQWTEYLEDTLEDDSISKILEKTAKLSIGENAPNPTTPTAE